MRKITFIIALLCSISAFSTRYLVQNNGTTLWNGTATGTIVTLGVGQALNAWYSANSATLVAGTDEIWLATGVYVTDGTITLKNGVSLYGGFAGTEALLADRAKGANAWNFTNSTTIDGNLGNRQGIITGAGTTATVIDGITVTKYAIIGAAANVTGVGVVVNSYWTMQNCIVTANTFNNSTNQCRGAGVYIKGGQLLNSYIYNNSAIKMTGGGSTYGGGVAFSYNASPVTTVKGCTIESNTSTVVGGGMAIIDGTGGTIEDCIFKTNINVAGSGGAIGTSSTTGAHGTLSIKNCQFLENTAATSNGGGAYLSLSSTSPATTTIEGCLFSGNTALTQGGALDIEAGTYSPVKNCIFRDNKITNAVNGANASSALYCGIGTVTIQNSIFANNTSAANTVTNNTIRFVNAGNKLLNCTVVNNSNPGTAGYALNFDGKVGTITNCVFLGNTGAGTFKSITTGVVATYNATDNIDIFGAVGSGNNIKSLTAINTFVNPTGFAGVSTDATTKTQVANADWSMLIGSPAVDAGTDLSAEPILITADIVGTTRPKGTAYDMGAYERSGTATSENSIKNSILCLSTNNGIEISGLNKNENVSVYGITGNIIYNQRVMNSTLSIALPKGIYLVRASDKVSKVIVK